MTLSNERKLANLKLSTYGVPPPGGGRSYLQASSTARAWARALIVARRLTMPGKTDEEIAAVLIVENTPA
jgi:hypothetical protein